MTDDKTKLFPPNTKGKQTPRRTVSPTLKKALELPSDPPNIYLFLGRLEGKLDALIAAQATEIARITRLEERVNSLEIEVTKGDDLKRLEDRLMLIEAFKQRSLGIIAVLVIVFTAVVQAVTKLLFGGS